MKGQGVDEEGVDVTDRLGSYRWGGLVVRGLDRRECRGYDHLDRCPLDRADSDVEHVHGMALGQGREKVGEQHVEAGIVCVIGGL